MGLALKKKDWPSSDPYKPDWGVSTFNESWDRARGLYRVDWMRPRANGGMRDYTEIFSNEVGNRMGGYVTGIDVNLGQPARAVGPAHCGVGSSCRLVHRRH
jgi:hypothetical protein